MATVLVFGSGLAGLSTAFYLLQRAVELRRGLTLKVMDTAHAPRSELASEQLGEVVLEHGPNGFFDGAPHTRAQLQRLRLEHKLMSASPEAGPQAILHKGNLERLPSSPSALLSSPLVSTRARLRVLQEPLIGVRKGGADESLLAFLTRRVGEEAGTLGAELLAGTTFFGDPARLSAAGAFPRLVARERSEGSLVQGVLKSRLEAGNQKRLPYLALEGGMGQWRTALLDQPQLQRRVFDKVPLLSRVGGQAGALRLHADSGAEDQADAVVMALPAAQAGEVVRALDPGLAQLLTTFRTASVASMHYLFPLKQLKEPQRISGFAAPRGTRSPVRMAVLLHQLFPGSVPEGHGLVRVFIGGGGEEERLQRSDEELLSLGWNELANIMGIFGKPSLQHLHRLNFHQYELGHPERLVQLEQTRLLHPQLFFTGGSYRGIGLNEQVKDAYETAEQVMTFLRAQEDK